MTKKDYTIISKVIGNCLSEAMGVQHDAIRMVMYHLADRFLDNPQFDRDKFINACLLGGMQSVK